MKLNEALVPTMALVLIILLIWMGDLLPVQIFCLFHRITGIPCPGCGTVRAIKLLISGNFMLAIYTNPVSVAMFLAIPFIVIGLWLDYFRGTNIIDSLRSIKLNKVTIVLLILITLLNWIWNIQKGL